MPTVELVYDGDCPNVAEARAQLMRALARTKLQPTWQEWRGDDPASPEHVRGYGSPTVLVDGQDVSAGANSSGACCRLYEQADGRIGGAPSVDVIAAALERRGEASEAANGGQSWTFNLAMLPGIGAVFLPKVACPACWPAYAGFLSSVGLGFMLDTTYLLPLTTTFLALAVGALAYGAKRRRGYLPFVLGLVAAAVVLIGKFTFESDPAMYTGLAVLVGASAWNTWPRREQPATCPACLGEGPQSEP